MAQELITKSLPDNAETKIPSKIEVTREVDGETKKFEVPLTKSYYLKGAFRGYPYLHPDVSAETMQPLMEAYGEDFIVETVKKAFQAMGRAALEFATEAHRETKVDADGKKIGIISFVDSPKWLQALATGEYRGETISELQDKVEAKQLEVQDLAKKLIVKGPDGRMSADAQVGLQIQKLSEIIAKLNEQISNKRRKGKDTSMEEEDDSPVPAPVA